VIIGIVAVAKNFAIGKDGKLPWHYPADLKFFKQTTTGNAIAMGATTFRSIGRALPNRLNIVLTRKRSVQPQQDMIVLSSTDEVGSLNKYLNCDLFVIGGASTYHEFAPMIDKWIVTEIPITVEGADAFMPEDFLDEFYVEEQMQLADGLMVKMFTRR
jgi:dihydrofolate reductase